jgi:AbrB family looped-hinge helix DNA binding protein
LETTTVTRKGQVTIPAPLRKKYGIREGMKMEVLDAQAGFVLRPIPRMEDLAGVDAGKYTYSEMVERLDKLRQRWR